MMRTNNIIINIIAGQEHLRSKRELIEEFIDSHLMGIAVDDEFERFWEGLWLRLICTTNVNH